LSLWSCRHFGAWLSKPRRAANTAMDEIDAMLAELHSLRARLVSEIRASDDAHAERLDAMLGGVHQVG
jgi:hypothetical protein